MSLKAPAPKIVNELAITNTITNSVITAIDKAEKALFGAERPAPGIFFFVEALKKIFVRAANIIVRWASKDIPKTAGSIFLRF